MICLIPHLEEGWRREALSKLLWKYKVKKGILQDAFSIYHI